MVGDYGGSTWPFVRRAVAALAKQGSLQDDKATSVKKKDDEREGQSLASLGSFPFYFIVYLFFLPLFFSLWNDAETMTRVKLMEL